MLELKDFLGTWCLIPEEAKYEFGNVPLSGAYTICEQGEQTLRFEMTWTDENEVSHALVYTTQVDDQLHPYENKEIAEFLKTTLVAGHGLESRIYKANQEIGYARRVLIGEQTKLAVIQVMTSPKGESVTNYAVYERVNEKR